MDQGQSKAAASASSSEDQAAERGESIATFAYYQPTALPGKLVHVLNGFDQHVIEKEKPKEPEVIELLDDEDDSNEANKKEKSADSPNIRLSTTITCPSHTSSACESALLASVRAPVVEEEAAECLIEPAKTKALSPLQLEGALLAIKRHRRIYGSEKKNGGVRAGFFLGDGAGVGKGRQIAAILRDSLCRQNQIRRHIWLSVSRELIQDARRDLQDVGVHCPVHDGTDLLDSSAALGAPNKGVLFVTYALLVSSQRMEQIISWASGSEHLNRKSQSQQILQNEQSFNGCIIFDEAHKAKNLTDNSKTAKLVIELQRRLPLSKVVYCSATGVSDVKHMVYAERLGLWNTPSIQSYSLFPNFAYFQRSLEQRGLGSLEVLALEMKQQDSFIARTLSWDGAEFETTEVELDAHQRAVYDQAVQWWMTLKAEIENVLSKLSKMKNAPNRMVWRIFWSAHQRFFRELAICAKVKFVARDALRVSRDGGLVVIGLQSTGDAGMQSVLDDLKASPSSHNDLESLQFPHLLSTVSSIMTNFVRNHFPVALSPPEIPKVPEQPPPTASVEEQRQYMMLKNEAARIAALPPPKPFPDLLEKRRQIIDSIKLIALPPNPLDDLIERLGGVDQVAEMTGRPGRIIRAPSKNYYVYSKRVVSSSEEETDRVNLVEKRKFMDGTKPFAIISDAASTGISLHAARGSGASHKRRVHYTIELPWSADKAVQQLGRSHRSGQESAPIYKLIVTDLGGERRFAAAVSKRMQNLGALTKGDRRAATGSEILSDFDLDSRYGKEALRRFYSALSHIVEQPNVRPSRNTDTILDSFVGALIKANDPTVSALPSLLSNRRLVVLSRASSALDDIGLGSDTRKSADVKAFLNRILGLPVAMQNLIFSLFMSTLEDVIADAKATGEFDGTAEDIKASSIKVLKKKIVAVDTCNAKTVLTTLALDRGVSFATVCDMALDASLGEASEGVPKRQTKNRRQAPSGFYVSRNRIAGRHLILFAKRKFNDNSFRNESEAWECDPLGLMVITRPNTGTNTSDMPTRDLNTKYRLLLSSHNLNNMVKTPSKQTCTLSQSEGDESNKILGGDDSADENVSKEKMASTTKRSADKDTSKGMGDALDTQKVPGVVSPSTAEEKTEAEQKSGVTDHLDGISSLSLVEIVTDRFPQVAKEWNCAFKESNHFSHQNGLAPRRAKLGLVTGAVLHILPALEKAVVLRSGKDRALKIVRAELSSERLVGIRFPADKDALQGLQAELDLVRKAQSSAGNSFHDERIESVCPKSLAWATAERKTMKSFFTVVSKGATPNAKCDLAVENRSNRATHPSSATPRPKRTSLASPVLRQSSSSKKKRKSIPTFFTKKS